MPFPIPSEEIAKITNSKIENVNKNWPLINAACKEQGLTSVQTVVGVIATVGVECHFLPIHENGTPEYFKKTYSDRKDFVLDESGKWKWRGRGFVQLTGEYNYRKYGTAIGVDLIANPDKALEPATAAKILAVYFKDHGCAVWAARGHWLRIRELVNGKPKDRKPNGWNDFIEAVWKLLSAAYK